MIDLSSPTLATHYCFWWKDEHGNIRHTYGSEEETYPGDWADSREEAERVHRHWLEGKMLHKDTEWGIAEREMPVYRIATDLGEVVVLLDEEYGYRTWLWKTGMTAEALVKWWMGMDTVRPHFMDPSKSLPGELCAAQPMGLKAWIVSGPEGEVHVEDPTSGWMVHLHMDDDSFLRTPAGKEVLHQGYSEE
jgi:hypothetical protein